MSLPHPHDDPRLYLHVIEKRLLAWVIDLIITALLVTMALMATLGLTLLLFPVLWFAVSVTYRTWMLRRYGATLGMMVAALQLRRLDGQRADETLCLWHALIYAGSMVFVMPQVVSVVLMLLTPHRQGLPDWLLGTVIINRPHEA